MGDVELVGDEVLRLLIASGFDPRLIFRAVMPHHGGRGLREPFDLESRLVPDRQADRSESAGHALLPEPLLGGRNQRLGSFAVEHLKHAPLARALAHMLLDELVDLRADAAHDFAAALRQPQLGLGMLEPRVLARCDQAVDLVL